LKPSKLILADEPTGNLDESNRDDIIKILLEMQKKGKTIIIVTHDNVVAQNCNTVIEI
jgi:putative ABC transport system ATP-binding protein